MAKQKPKHPNDKIQIDIDCPHCVTLLMAKRTQDALAQMGLKGLEPQLIPEAMLVCAILTAARTDDVLALLSAPPESRTDPHDHEPAPALYTWGTPS